MPVQCLDDDLGHGVYHTGGIAGLVTKDEVTTLIPDNAVPQKKLSPQLCQEETRRVLARLVVLHLLLHHQALSDQLVQGDQHGVLVLVEQ